MKNPKIVNCIFCGEPYHFYIHTVADQSRCPACIRDAKKRIKGNERKEDEFEKIEPKWKEKLMLSNLEYKELIKLERENSAKILSDKKGKRLRNLRRKASLLELREINQLD